MFNFQGKLDDLLDAEEDSAGAFVGWVRLAQWLPWMEMGSRSGKMYFHAGGSKVGDYENVPASFRATIEEHYPLYRHAPPLARRPTQRNELDLLQEGARITQGVRVLGRAGKLELGRVFQRVGLDPLCKVRMR